MIAPRSDGSFVASFPQATLEQLGFEVLPRASPEELSEDLGLSRIVARAINECEMK